jgi:hypothetical protein
MQSSEDKDTLPFKCTSQSLNILSAFPQISSIPHRARISEVNINKAIPWAFFDGASQGNPQMGGAREIIFLSQNHFLKFKYGIDKAKNNLSELTALKLVPIPALEKGISQIQVLGDSLLVIQWMKGDSILRNFMLQPLFRDIN